MLYSCQYDYVPWNFQTIPEFIIGFIELSISINVVDGWWVENLAQMILSFVIENRNEPFSIDNVNNYIAFIAFERTFSHIFRPSFTIQASRTSRRVGVTARTIFLVCRISIYSKYTRSIIRQITFEMFRRRKLFRIYVCFSVPVCDCVLCLLCLKEDKLCQYLQNREHFPCSCSAFGVPFLRQSFERDNFNEKVE